MGVQSLSESVLDRIARRHSPQQAEDAIRMLVGTGLIVNVDLIYALPGQDEASFRRDLHRVAELGVHALTLYDLRVGERTQVGARLDTRERLDLERLLRWRTFVRDTAAEAGFVQTRWHTFKRKDSIARNHRWMPTFDDESLGFQLGVGNSARSHLGAAIYRNIDGIRPYVDRVMAGQSPVDQIFILDEHDRRALYVSRSIGDGGAIDREHYQSSFGLSFDADHGERIARLRETGLVSDDGNRIGLTELGKLVHDRVTLSFYPERGLAQLRQREQRIDARILTARERAAAN
jgi:oxygen-independent coproporphyrinogen-3 oxidase